MDAPSPLPWYGQRGYCLTRVGVGRSSTVWSETGWSEVTRCNHQWKRPEVEGGRHITPVDCGLVLTHILVLIDALNSPGNFLFLYVGEQVYNFTSSVTVIF